jgi:hypothetical protein
MFAVWWVPSVLTSVAFVDNRTSLLELKVHLRIEQSTKPVGSARLSELPVMLALDVRLLSINGAVHGYIQ